jgi:hypothetical protein
MGFDGGADIQSEIGDSRNVMIGAGIPFLLPT